MHKFSETTYDAAEQRHRQAILDGRRKSVDLVRYTFARGMRVPTMYKIWGQNFVDTCLLDGGNKG